MSRSSVKTSSAVQCNSGSQPSTVNPQSDMNWFAIRVSYSRELALKAILDAEKIENFIPMRYEYVIKSGKRVRRLLPAIHILVFIITYLFYSLPKKIELYIRIIFQHISM